MPVTIELPSGRRVTVRRGVWEGKSVITQALNVASPDVGTGGDPDRFLAEWAVRTYGASIVDEDAGLSTAVQTDPLPTRFV